MLATIGLRLLTPCATMADARARGAADSGTALGRCKVPVPIGDRIVADDVTDIDAVRVLWDSGSLAFHLRELWLNTAAE